MREKATIERASGMPGLVRNGLRQILAGGLTCRCGAAATVLLNGGKAHACAACVVGVRADLTIARQRRDSAAMKQTNRQR
jgi:hypothetical protein